MMVKITRTLCLSALLGLAASTAMANEVSLKNMSGQTMPVIYEFACYHDSAMVEYSQQYETIIPGNGAVHVPVHADEQNCAQSGVVVKAVGVGSADHALPLPGEEVLEPVHDPVVEPVNDPVLDPMVEPVNDPVLDPVVEPVNDPMVEPVQDPVLDPVHHEDPIYHVDAHWEYLSADLTNFANAPGCWVAVSHDRPHSSIDLMTTVDDAGHSHVTCHVAE